MVAYGASQFTRDADFWVNPTAKNLNALQTALRELKARPRFLPPMELAYLQKGHGVHFRFRHEGRDFLIDLLGKPPRVFSSFGVAAREAARVSWHGLSVPILDIPRLVDTKKTNRDRDYPVIEKLADLVFENARSSPRLRKQVLPWLLSALRNPKHLRFVIERWGGMQEAGKSERKAVALALQNAGDEVIQRALDEEKETLKKANLSYWKPFLEELRKLRKRNTPASKMDGVRLPINLSTVA